MRLTPITRRTRATEAHPGRGRLKAVAALSAVAMMAVAGGVALFSDSDQTESINVTTGAVEIVLDGVTGSVSAPFGDIVNFAPGETDEQRIDLTDLSTIDLGTLNIGVQAEGPDAAALEAAGDDGFVFTLLVCDDPAADPNEDCEGDLVGTGISGENLAGALGWDDEGDGIDVSDALDALDLEGTYQLTAQIAFSADADDTLEDLDVDLTFHAYAEQAS